MIGPMLMSRKGTTRGSGSAWGRLSDGVMRMGVAAGSVRRGQSTSRPRRAGA
jgi:hypothetical protein